MFWLKIVLLSVILALLISIVNLFLKQVFKIEEEKDKKLFSFSYINNLHIKIDWTFKSIFAITFVVILYLVFYKNYSINYFLITLVVFIVVDYSVKAFFEWKHSQNPKHSILTINEMTFLIVAIIMSIQLELFSKLF